MTPTEQAIVYGWLFLLTLAAVALFAGWLDNRQELKMLARMALDLIEWREAMMSKTAKAALKPKRRQSKADIPIALVPTQPGDVIDLSTPLAERSRAVPFGEETEPLKSGQIRVVTENGCEWVDAATHLAAQGHRGVGGTKPDGDGGGEAA